MSTFQHLTGRLQNSQSFYQKPHHLHARMLLSVPLCSRQKWKHSTLQLKNTGRRAAFPTSFLDCFSSSVSGDVPPLLSQPPFPLFALYPAYSFLYFSPHTCNPVSWKKSFLLHTSSKPKGISHTSSQLTRNSLSNLTQAKPF